MKILITGANGQLGRELQKRLKGTQFLATDLQNLDITDEAAVAASIGSYKPDLVVHGAAWTQVDLAEEKQDLAWQVNAIGTQNIARACRQNRAAMVYISTDYVFDGALGRAYRENDATNPLSVYGKSKLAGELLARQETDRLFILRTAWLYGDGPNFVRTMLKLGQEREELQVVNDQHGCPTCTTDLVEALLRLIVTREYGVYHAVNTGVTTWYDFACKIFALSGNNRVKVLPVTTGQFVRPAPRPVYSPLDVDLLQSTVDSPMRPWEEALAEYLITESKQVKT
jgi:dTDP-4-dehydrorhamnose reductase